jgi:hypothetical protein
MSLEQTSDRNDEMRAVKPLSIAEKMPQPVRKAMPAVSDMEINLRLNVPDNLATSGEWPYKYITQEIDSHADASASAIRKDPSA